MSDIIYQWIDLIWLPVGWFFVPRKFRVKMIAFILTCIVTLRLQVEMIESTGNPTGFLSIMESSIFARGLIIYGIIIGLFVLLAHFSPGTRRVVFMLAAINIYFFTLCLTSVVMCL
jgi:hypothetical protein